MNLSEIYYNILHSLNTNDQGFSYRKLTALVVLCLIIYLHLEFVNFENAETFLIYDFGFIAVLLGLLNLDRFVAAKWGNKPSSEEGTNTTN